MGNYEQLKQAVADVIKSNGNQEITGAILQNALLTIISTIGNDAIFAGIATPDTNPGTPDQNVFYIASTKGLYSNFNGTILDDEVLIFKNTNGNWESIKTGISTFTNTYNVGEKVKRNAINVYTQFEELQITDWLSGAVNSNNGSIDNVPGWVYKQLICDGYSSIECPFDKSGFGYGLAFYNKNGQYINGVSETEYSRIRKNIEIPLDAHSVKISKSDKNEDSQVVFSYSDMGSYKDFEGYSYALIDKDGRLLFGVTDKGEIIWYKGLPLPIKLEIEKIYNAFGYLKETFSYIDNDDYCKVLTDENEKILFGFKKDGNVYFPKNETYNIISDDDYIAVWTDLDGRILFGIKNDGSLYPFGKEIIDSLRSEIKYIEANNEKIIVILDFFDFINIKKIGNYVDGYIIPLGNIGIGGTVLFNPEKLSGYRYSVIDCNPLEIFIINGEGGNNPRLWAFLDENNVIICMAEPFEIGENKFIQAPINAKKIVINDNKKLDSYINVGGVLDSVFEASKGNNGILYNTPDDTMCAFINGITFADELKTHITGFKKDGDLMVHVSTFYIINEIIYVTYYVNTRSSAEKPSEHTARFVFCPLNNTDDKTYIDLCDVGDIVLGKTVTELYDIVMFKADGNDDLLYLAWTVALDGEYYRVYRTYTISTGELGEIFANTFTVGNVTETFNITGMEKAMNDNSISFKKLSGDIGLMQKLSYRIEGGVKYYYTGCYVGAFNCILKSADFINWIFVTQPPFVNDSQWENATYVLNDKVFYCVRQYANKSNTAFLTYYDLNTLQWANPVYMYEAQSRYDFFMYNNQLYLIHSPKDRNHIAIMKIYVNLPYSYDVQVAKIPDYFYPFVQVYGQDIYVSFTASRQNIYLSKISIEKDSTDEIINKFKQIFFN